MKANSPISSQNRPTLSPNSRHCVNQLACVTLPSMIARLLFLIVLGCVVQTALPQESSVGVDYAAIYDTIVRADRSAQRPSE